MNSQAAAALNTSINHRMVAAVAKRLDVPVILLRQEEFVFKGRRTGALVPVFGVPAEMVHQVEALGLRAEAL